MQYQLTAALPSAVAPAVSHAARYRRDIDGMRALAVLAVIIFHINKDLLPGGFIGVDVFFVISGYLISAHIFESARRKKFSFIDFYCRRIRRIAPAMIVVVSVTLLLSQWLMLPEDARGTAKSALMSFASMTNVYFWLNQDTSYFAASSNEIPLLHLWSLGVEEQFYVIWPPIAILICRWRARYALSTMLALTLASFALGQTIGADNPTFSYYMLPTRCGEMLMGAMAAHISLSRERMIPSRWALPLAGGGLCLVLASIALLSERVIFPGWWAVPPTLGAAMLILGGGAGPNAPSRWLAMAPLRAVGLTSYSAYLWHWPLLALYRYGYGEPTLSAGISLFLLTMVFAAFTYLYVEQIVRNAPYLTWRVVFAAWCASSLGLGLVALGAAYSDRLHIFENSSYSNSLAQLRMKDRPSNEFSFVCQRMRLDENELDNKACVVNSDIKASKNVVLLGDSHAAHYVGMIGIFAKHANFSFRNFEVSACPPVFGEVEEFAHVKRAVDCKKSQAAWKKALAQANVVILGSTWSDYQSRSANFLPVLFHQVREYVTQGKKVVLLGKVPVIENYDRQCLSKALRFPFKHCDNQKNPLPSYVAEVNDQLRQFAQATHGVEYFDPNAMLCLNGICSAYSKTGENLYYDKHHLSMEGSQLVGLRLYQETGVPKAFKFDSI